MGRTTAMAVIRWSSAMSVGVAALDRDHQVLVDLIRRIADAREEDGAVGPLLAEVLAELVAYTMYHFDREEHVMAACGYPELEAHREEHYVLTREVADLQRRLGKGDPDLGRDELLAFLTGWLNHHILLQDKAYRAYAEGNPAATDAAEAYGEFDATAPDRRSASPDLAGTS
jgi:hemerythrin-like metal-binding protein